MEEVGGWRRSEAGVRKRSPPARCVMHMGKGAGHTTAWRQRGHPIATHRVCRRAASARVVAGAHNQGGKVAVVVHQEDLIADGVGDRAASREPEHVAQIGVMVGSGEVYSDGAEQASGCGNGRVGRVGRWGGAEAVKCERSAQWVQGSRTIETADTRETARRPVSSPLAKATCQSPAQLRSPRMSARSWAIVRTAPSPAASRTRRWNRSPSSARRA